QRRNVELLEDVQGLQDGHAAAARRLAVQVVVAVRRVERFGPAGPVLRKVSDREQAAVFLEMRHKTFSECAAVKYRWPTRGDGFERLGEIRLLEHLANGP